MALSQYERGSWDEGNCRFPESTCENEQWSWDVFYFFTINLFHFANGFAYAVQPCTTVWHIKQRYLIRKL